MLYSRTSPRSVYMCSSKLNICNVHTNNIDNIIIVIVNTAIIIIIIIFEANSSFYHYSLRTRTEC